jgi:hypothetical protein
MWLVVACSDIIIELIIRVIIEVIVVVSGIMTRTGSKVDGSVSTSSSVHLHPFIAIFIAFVSVIGVVVVSVILRLHSVCSISIVVIAALNDILEVRPTGWSPSCAGSRYLSAATEKQSGRRRW